MPTNDNKAVLDRAIAYWNDGDLTTYMEIYAPTIVLHGLPPGLPPGLAGVRASYEALWTAFPRPQLRMDDVIAEGDRLACRFHMSMTHQGEFMGIPPTGKTIEIEGMTILRFADGKCVERWTQADMLGWLQQLGALPAPASS